MSIPSRPNPQQEYLVKFSPILVGAGLCLAALRSPATTLSFDDLVAGTTLSSQYASLGVTFSANAFTGLGSSSSGAIWATNTDLTVVSATGTDVGSLGTPSMASGNVLRSFAGYLGEDGDASFEMSFSTAISSISVSYAGVSTASTAAAADNRLFIYDGTTLLATVAGTTGANQFVLTYSAPSITRVVVASGSFADYVAVDNVVFTPVPEPESYAMMFGGLIGIGALVRRRLR